MKLDLSDAEVAQLNLTAVSNLLATGRRKAAAAAARTRARVAGRTELAALVRMLADELDAVGNRQAKRGRQKSTLEDVKSVMEWGGVIMAAAAYADACTARDLVAGRAVMPRDLARLAVLGRGLSVDGAGDVLAERVDAVTAAIAEDPDGARAEILPHAKKMLHEFGLDRWLGKGFHGNAKRIIADQFGVSVDQMKRELAQ